MVSEEFLIGSLLLLIYLVPIFIAERKKHPHKVLIVRTIIVGVGAAVILLFTESFGWFGRLIAAVCWLVALIWCFVDPQKTVTVSEASESAETDDELNAEND